jgi:G3E family GTPase
MEGEDYDEELPTLIEIPEDNAKIIPITILSGFLGSGKTTLLNYILTKQHGKRIAVIENEFSAGLGVEGMMAKSGVDGESLDNFFELNNGCVSVFFCSFCYYFDDRLDLLYSERRLNQNT